MQSRSLAAVVVSAIAALATSLSADTIRVPADQPTIQAAVDAAVAGDVIALVPGDFFETVVIDGKTDIAIRGGKKAAVIGSGAGAPFTIQNSTGVLIDGVLADDGLTGVSIADSTGIVIQNCMIRDQTGDGVSVENSTGVIVQKCYIVDIEGHGVDLADAGGGAADTAVVAKNLFEGVDGNMVNVGGSGHVVAKNKAIFVGGIVIVAAGTDNLVEKNLLGATSGAAIIVDGEFNDVVKNKIILPTGAGIEVNGDDNFIIKNKIAETTASGIDIASSDNWVFNNKVIVTGGDGIEVGEVAAPGDAIGNILENNKVKSAAVAGFRISDGENILFKNKSGDCGTFDLHDDSGSGTNIFDNNKFATEQID